MDLFQTYILYYTLAATIILYELLILIFATLRSSNYLFWHHQFVGKIVLLNG